MEMRDQPRALRDAEESVRDRRDASPLPAGGAARVLALQRSAGNHSVSAHLARDPDAAKEETPASAGLAIVPEVGTIPLLSVSLADSRRSDDVGSSGGAAKRSLNRIDLTSRAGEHSPKLLGAATAGQPGTVEIVMSSLSLTLKLAMISSYAAGGANSIETRSLNHVSLEQK